MKFLLRILLSAFAVLLLSEVLPGVTTNKFTTAILVALVLSVLNFLVKPILIVLTLPVTIVTFGLFILVINAIIIMLADSFVAGFNVDGWFWAIVFSLLLSFLQSILYSILKEDAS
ncbi:phage holin family protein [Croceitalea dokdonensis]|nr:phage holin family protein [Croceitalea dokdonensis]